MRILINLLFLLASTSVLALSPPPPAPILVVPCAFGGTSDTPTSYSNIHAQISGLRNYWLEQSRGNFDPDVNTVPWVTIQPLDSYPNDGSRLIKIAQDCVAAAGPNVVSYQTASVFIVLNREVQPQSTATDALLTTLGGITKQWPIAWIHPYDSVDQPILAHEWGHMLGFQHTDNSDGDNDTYDNPWDMMSDATTLQNVIGINKVTKLWVPIEKISVISGEIGQTVLYDFVTADSGKMGAEFARVTFNNGEFLTIEPRRKRGYDANIPSDAIVVHYFRQNPYNGSYYKGYFVGTGSGLYADGRVGISVIQNYNDKFLVRVTVYRPIFSDGFE